MPTLITTPGASAAAVAALDAKVAKEASLAVPVVDAVANVDIADVIGNKSDTHDGTSITALTHKLNEHIHAAQKVYPTLADGIALTTHANDWVLSAIAQIVPAGAISSDFDIHEVIIEDVNTQDKTYELVLYAGAGDTEIGRTRFAAAANKGGVPNATMQTPLVAANSRIRAALAIEDGGSKTAKVSLRYHIY